MSSRSSIVRTVSALVLGAGLSLSVAACGGGAASGGGAETGGAAGSLKDKPAPEFSAETVGGEGPKTVKEAAGRVTVIDFWATFCGPCKKSFPKYQALMDEFGGDLAIIGVSVDEAENADKAKLEKFVSETGVKFGIVWDKSQTVVKAYGVEKMPTSFIIDKTGVIRHIHAGYGEGEEDKIAEEIRALVGGS